MRLFKIFLLFSIWFCSSVSAFGQHSKYLGEKIDKLTSGNAKNPFNGVIYLAQNGTPFYTKISGFSNINNKTPLKEDDQFVIGSVSKQFTAVLVLQEFDRGHLTLNAPIHTYLPELTQPWADTVTSLQLLTHMHGIIDLDQPLAFKAGSQFMYSQIGYDLLAKIVEKTSGKSFAQISHELFEKCNMKNTFHPELKLHKNLVQGHFKGVDGSISVESHTFENYVAAGGFISTAGDLTIWNRQLFGKNLLSETAYLLMTLPYPKAIRDHPVFGKTWYGCGLTISNDDGIFQYGQTGFAPGFVSMSFYFPESKTSVIVLENIVYDTVQNTVNLKNNFYHHTEILKILKEHLLAEKQFKKNLRDTIEKIVKSYKATIGVSILGIDDRDTLSINNNHHYPMQSVYKFPLALAVLNQIDSGNVSLNQKIYVTKKDLRRNTWSPLRDKYPKGRINISINELLEYMVSKSDNNACDILFNLMKGPAEIEKYIHKLGITDIKIVATENEMHQNSAVQYTNWTEPYSMTKLLDHLYINKFISDSSNALLLKTMTESSNSAGRLKGLLPKETPVAHKTGSSGADKKGLTAALNDVGIVTLPNGKHFAISVFVSGSSETFETNERIIAEIAKVTYDYFTQK